MTVDPGSARLPVPAAGRAVTTFPAVPFCESCEASPYVLIIHGLLLCVACAVTEAAKPVGWAPRRLDGAAPAS